MKVVDVIQAQGKEDAERADRISFIRAYKKMTKPYRSKIYGNIDSYVDPNFAPSIRHFMARGGKCELKLEAGNKEFFAANSVTALREAIESPPSHYNDELDNALHGLYLSGNLTTSHVVGRLVRSVLDQAIKSGNRGLYDKTLETLKTLTGVSK